MPRTASGRRRSSAKRILPGAARKLWGSRLGGFRFGALSRNRLHGVFLKALQNINDGIKCHNLCFVPPIFWFVSFGSAFLKDSHLKAELMESAVLGYFFVFEGSPVFFHGELKENHFA